MMVWFIETYHDYLSKKEMLSFIFLDLSSGALADLLHLILPIIPFLWLTRSHALLLWKKSLMKYLLLHKIFMDLFGLVFWPQDISPCSILVQWSIHRSLLPIVFVLAHCFSPRPANTSQSMLQNRCQYFFCSTCIFYLLLFPEIFRSEVHTFDDMNCTLSIMAFTITTHTLLIQFMFIQE